MSSPLVTSPTHTDRRRTIAGATLVLMAAFVTSRLLGLVREMVIYNQFGTSRALDAYRAAFNVPDLIFELVAGGALAAALIPTFTAYLAKGRQDEAWHLASAVMTIACIAATAVAAVVFVLAPWIVPLIVPGFEPAAQALTVQLVRLMLLAPILAVLSGIAAGVLNSHQRFTLPALSPVVYNLAIIAGALWLAPRWGVRGLAVSVVAGAALHFGIQVPGLARLGLVYRPSLDWRHPGVRQVGRLLGPRLAGLAVARLNFFVNTILASVLAVGSLAALNLAWQLNLLPWSIVAMTIATAVFPTLAEQAAQARNAELRATLAGALRVTLFLAIPASVGLLVLRVPLVQLLFQRGEFTAISTAMTAWALLFYALGLGGIATTEIVTRGFYALHDTRTPVLVAAVAVATNILLSLLFVWLFGALELGPQAAVATGGLRNNVGLLGGLALANTIANALEAVALLVFIRRRLGGLDDRRLLRSLGRVLLASLAMGLAVGGFLALAAGRLDLAHLSGRLALVGGGVAVGLLAYLGATLLLRSEELAALSSLLQRR